MKRRWFGVSMFVVWAAVAGCANSPGSATPGAVDQPTTTRAVKGPTPAGQVGVVPAATGMAAPIPLGQRTRVGELDILVAGPAVDGDGKVLDKTKGADSYASEGKKFLLVPMEVSRHTGATKPLPKDSQVVLTYAGAAQSRTEDFATNCPYDEEWPDKVDLWTLPIATGETVKGNACFIVSVQKANQFVLGYAPFGTRIGAETFFKTI